ncbi:hypothetical protein ONZ45_g15728 [Pleurotus djamor]|nr:hypothetical protein ONZ45_g15728 [Pleurotus djamor]
MLSIIDQIVSGYSSYYKTQYVQLSSLTFLLWEYLVTLPDEVQLFWTCQWTYPTILFFINRYQIIIWQIFHTIAVFIPKRSERVSVFSFSYPLSLTDDFPLYSCEAWIHRLSVISGVMILVPVYLIVSLRIYAMYNRSRAIRAVLAVMLLATISSQIYVTIRHAPKVLAISLPLTDLTACAPFDTSHLYLTLVPAISFDFPALLLVLARGIFHLKLQRRIGFQGSSLVLMFTRDSVAYFVVILLSYIALAISWIILPDLEMFISFGFGFSSVSVAATRLLLNTRRELREPVIALDHPLELDELVHP